ncbi:hypothetical protein V6N11_056976 [Hibiscus sabdariffa]|uniref:Uncharacterized protein n=1 Tax=Hibiscus sabdariffa TaxID=183260 RepID=A0ABR2T608_9ROSI
MEDKSFSAENSVGQKKVTAGGREIGRLKEGHNSRSMPRERNVDTVPTSLKSNKHVVIHVVEEGAKRVLKESNSRSSYGPIRKVYTKALNRDSMVNAGLP